MRLIIIVLVLLFSNWPKVSGQSMAFNNSAFAHYEQSGKDNYPSIASNDREHCRATRGGELCMAVGGGMLIGALLLAPSQIPANTNKPTDQGLWVVVIGVGGAVLIIEGVISFIGGEIYDRTGQRRLSIIGKQNQVGFAYNF